MKRWLAGLAVVATLAISAPAHAQSWQSTKQLDHPLVGRIWDVAQGRFISRDEVETVLRNRTFVILGEKHDNPDHHLLQDQVLESLIAVRKRPALVMEQFDTENQAAIDEAQTRAAGTEALVDAGKFNRKGWKWPQYKELVDTAVAYKLPLVAGNLSRAAARKVYSEGFSALPPRIDAPLFDTLWNDARAKSLHEDLVEGHCGKLDPAMAPGMMRAQRARDAWLAAGMRDHAQRGAVLITGSGHARKDRAVPLWLRHWMPDATQVSVVFTEVDAAKREPREYSHAEKGAFDYVWFTPEAERPDPCSTLTMPSVPAKAPATAPVKQ
jgi:uncharacterized iron-regulated protein